MEGLGDATVTLTEQSSTTIFFPGTTIPGFDELVASSQVELSEEMRPRVATLVAMKIAEDTNTEEESHYSGLLIYDMKSSIHPSHMNPPLMGRVIAEPQSVTVLKYYEGLLLHNNGMHMVVVARAV